MTSIQAMAHLKDSLRAEIIAELVEKLRDLAANADGGDDYTDGVLDAITTLEEAK